MMSSGSMAAYAAAAEQPDREDPESPRERPILFSGPMVRAILDGTKTQTRRVVTGATSEVGTGLPWSALNWLRCFVDGGFPTWQYLTVGGPDESLHRVRCRIGQPGDRLWVRETWLPDPPINGWPGDIAWNGCGRRIDGVPDEYRKPAHCLYAATWDGTDLCWRPSIHMPRWASRISLELTGVRVERLRDITVEDAIAEGIHSYGDGSYKIYTPTTSFGTPHPRRSFETLWDARNAKRGYGWDVNPWVWVLSFARVTP